MVIYNAATRELTAKIVYYGPGLCGKTTNLKVLHDRLEPGTAGKLLNLQTQTDRTIYFDLLPVELGDIKGYKIRFQLATVPGQTAFNETRRVVLKGVDGIVFVADSQWTMLPKNLESWQNLKDNLKSNEISFEKIPVVVQYNKRDLADILAVDAMQEALGLSSYPFVEAVASAGRGVTETFKLISKLTFVDLLRRLQGRRAEEASAATAAAVPEEARPDDLQTWKDSLLKRESQAAAAVARPSRPLALVPPVSDEAPFDTTELAREAEAEDSDNASPYAVPEPPGMGTGAPIDLAPPPVEAPIDAIEIEIPTDEPEEPEDAPEILSEADAVDAAVPAERGSVRDPAFLSSEAVASGERIALLEERLREAEGRAAREREVAERLDRSIGSLEERAAQTQNQIAEIGGRCRTMENSLVSLQEALGSFMERLGQVEQAAERQSSAEASLRNLEAAVQSLDDRARGETNRQRKDADDVAMALSSLTERASQFEAQIAAVVGHVGSQNDQLSSVRQVAEALPRLEDQVRALVAVAEQVPALGSTVEAVLRQHRELETILEEKTQQGRREAEDIRSQIAPLLEERVRRHESDALLFSEMERLRESLAESLHDLAERLRNAVRE